MIGCYACTSLRCRIRCIRRRILRPVKDRKSPRNQIIRHIKIARKCGFGGIGYYRIGVEIDQIFDQCVPRGRIEVGNRNFREDCAHSLQLSDTERYGDDLFPHVALFQQVSECGCKVLLFGLDLDDENDILSLKVFENLPQRGNFTGFLRAVCR